MDPTENISTGSESGSPANTGPTGDSSISPSPIGDPSSAAPSSAVPKSAVPSQPDPVDPQPDEVVELDSLESDLAAVEQAITTLDEISSRGVGGELAANEISAAVSKERFGR